MEPIQLVCMVGMGPWGAQGRGGMAMPWYSFKEGPIPGGASVPGPEDTGRTEAVTPHPQVSLNGRQLLTREHVVRAMDVSSFADHPIPRLRGSALPPWGFLSPP